MATEGGRKGGRVASLHVGWIGCLLNVLTVRPGRAVLVSVLAGWGEGWVRVAGCDAVYCNYFFRPLHCPSVRVVCVNAHLTHGEGPFRALHGGRTTPPSLPACRSVSRSMRCPRRFLSAHPPGSLSACGMPDGWMDCRTYEGIVWRERHTRRRHCLRERRSCL